MLEGALLLFVRERPFTDDIFVLHPLYSGADFLFPFIVSFQKRTVPVAPTRPMPTVRMAVKPWDAGSFSVFPHVLAVL